VQLGGPTTTVASATFGTITSENGHSQRQVTLAIKLMFSVRHEQKSRERRLFCEN
jgi:hypothetical protein